MKIWILAIWMAMVALASSAPTPEDALPLPLNTRLQAPYIRVARANPSNPEPNPKDLEGSESAYLAYPYVYSPYLAHYPYVIYGK